MEQQQRSLFFTAAVGLIILSIIVGSIYYLVKFIQSRVASNNPTSQASVETLGEVSENPDGTNVEGAQATSSPGTINIPQTPTQLGQSGNAVPTQPRAATNKKLYNPGTFQLYYPSNWGILTCTNSANFELDPVSPINSKIECATAVKPITILIDNIDGCDGDVLKLGNSDVIKSRKVDGEYIAYRWCTKTDPVLNITHRVSKGGGRAVSPTDYASQIEEMISSLTLNRGS